MSYLVTARKWRPQTFEEVIGQEHITTTLKNALTNDRIAHAFLFAGPRGVGKTTTARILAKRLNCLNPKGGEPCNECEMCKTFLSSQSLDIIEIDGASNRRIEEIRTLRESVKYAPTKGSHKIYIIDEVHMLTTESFNALLKTLEEPPEHTIFIFATTDVHKVPLTIISRCQRFDFRRIDLNSIKSLLAKIAESEKISIDDKALTLIAKKADGALRDAQSLLDQVISFSGNEISSETLSQMLNLIDEEIYFEISDAILQKKFLAAFEVSNKLYENGWNFIDFVSGLIEHFRNIMTVVITKNTDLIETAEVYRDKYLGYKNKFSEGDLLRVLAFLNKTQYEIKSAQNQKLNLEIALTHLIGLEKSETISNLLKKIDSGEMPKTKLIDTEIPKEERAEKKKPVRKVETAHQEKAPVKEKINSSETISFELINERWNSFVEKVSKDKFMMGGLIKAARPKNLAGIKLNIVVTHKDDIAIFEAERLYFLKATEEIFGTKLELNFLFEDMPADQIKPDAAKLNTSVSSESEEDSPLIKSLKENLGAVEIK